MDKRVILSIKGNQTSFDGQNNSIELITEGRLYTKENKYYIEYEESEISGIEGTKTSFIVEDNKILIERAGNHETKFVFQTGRKSINCYQTPFGYMELGIYSSKVDWDIDDKHGKLDIHYQLDFGGQYASFNSLLISYDEAN